MAIVAAHAIRTLHVVDLENLAGGTTGSAGDFLDVMDRYRSVVRIAATVVVPLPEPTDPPPPLAQAA